MGYPNESRRIEVIKTTPFLIGITIATLVIIAGTTALGVVYGGNYDKTGNSTNGVNIENNINVQVGPDGINSNGISFYDLFFKNINSEAKKSQNRKKP